MTRDFPTIQILPLAATWMDLEIIISSKISQEEKEEISCDIPLYVEPKIWYEWTFLFLKTKQKQTHKDRKQIYGYQGERELRRENRECGINIYTLLYIHISEKAMAPHSRALAWKIPWMEEPGGLQSTGSLRVRHDWATSLSLFTFTYWRRKRQPTPVFLPGESQGRGSLMGCRVWGRTESDTTEVT